MRSIESGILKVNIKSKIPVESTCAWLKRKGLVVPKIFLREDPVHNKPPIASLDLEVIDKPLRAAARDKAACEALAQVIWEQNPEMTITDLIKHPWIQKYGNGAQYKGVAIPKKQGGQRMLGVPTVSDRVAQMVVKLTFEPHVEPHFKEDSYGYRPNKSAEERSG